MKKLLLLCFVSFMFIGLTKANESYKLNNAKLDAMFSSATEIPGVTADMNMLSNSLFAPNESNENNTTKVLIAWVVDWVGLGVFGIHRYVLGTKGSMWAIYTFTCGGIFGIVPFVDWWVLLIDGLISNHGEKYINNPKFFMWAGK